MDLVNWKGTALEGSRPTVPMNLRETVFDQLPPPIQVTPEIKELGQRYMRGEIDGRHYAAMQAAAFILPKPTNAHRSRRSEFRKLASEAEAAGFVIPDVFRHLVETDEYVDRLHHNSIWLQMPEELWRLPADSSKLMFLAFVEGQGCCNWHLLLSSDGSHCMVTCEHPFGLPSVWHGGVPDYSQWDVQQCADTVEEWLYHYFRESCGHNAGYIRLLETYRGE